MKNICLIFVILFMLLSGLSVIAQSAQIAWGEQFELDKKNRLYRLVGMDEVNYYVISGQVKKSEFELLTFEISDHKLVNTHPLNFKYDKTKYTFLNSIQTTAGMFLYYFENNKAANKIELFVAKIEQGKLGDFLLVHSQDKVEGLFSNHLLNSQLSIFGNGYKVKVNQQISPDKKLVTLSYRQEIKGRFDDFQLLCLNENMELEWHKKIDFSEEKKKIFIGDFQIDTDGTIYCLTRVHKHAFKEVVKDLINKSLSKDYFFRVYKINEEREYFDFVFDKNSIYDPEKVLLVLKNGKSLPALTGIYATKNKNASTKGSFYATMDNMDDPPDVKFFPFKNISLVSRNFRDNWDKLDSPKPNYNYIKSYQFENGNLALILENHVVQSVRIFKERTNTYDSETTYYTDELLIFLFDKNGELMTDTIVNKQLWTEYGALSSFAGFIGNQNLYLLYNHEMRKKERKANGVKGTPTTMTVFSEEGKLTTETLFSNGNKAIVPYFYPAYVAKNKNHFLFGRFMGQKFTFGTLPLE